MNSYYRFFLSICLYLAIMVACIYSSRAECIEADDFGFSTVTVPAKPDNVVGEEGNEVAPWMDSNLRLDGNPLTIIVKEWEALDYPNTEDDLSAWCPWYGSAIYNLKGNKLSPAAEFLPECQFHNDKTYTEENDTQKAEFNVENVPVINRPCLMKHGIGLYALLAKPHVNPNGTIKSKRYGIKGESINFHVGQKYYNSLKLGNSGNYDSYDISPTGDVVAAGGYIHKFKDDSEKRSYAGGKLYFKILDRDYSNNNGQYKVIIKSGVNHDDGGPYRFLVDIVKGMLFGVHGKEDGIVQSLYSNITSNSNYRFTVNITLIFFVMFSTLGFLLGNISMTSSELISRVFKICIISMLLNSHQAWKFFYDNLFFIFLDGAEFIQHILKQSTSNGPGAADITSLMIAPQTFKKLMSLLFVHWGGIIYVIIYLLLLVYILIIGFKSTILYCNSLILLCIAIIVGPVFLCFVLFEFTKPLFERWLQQLIVYSIQPIILFAGIAFIGMLIRHEIYASLGFRVCQVPFLSLVNLITDNRKMSTNTEGALIKLWFPYVFTQRVNFNKKNCGNIFIPEDHVEQPKKWQCGEPTTAINNNSYTNGPNDNTNTTVRPYSSNNNDNMKRHCAAYECQGDRYTELPFLDPNVQRDQNRLDKFFKGNFVHWDGIFLLIICAGMLKIVNDNSRFVAEYISGGGAAATRATDETVKSVATDFKSLYK